MARESERGISRPASRPPQTLTEEERSAVGCRFDVAAGYPRLPNPKYLTLASIRDAARSVRNVAEATDASPKSAIVGLKRALRDFLKVHSQDVQIDVTFSGSVAVSRALAACQAYSDAAGLRRMELVMLSPSIDIHRYMAAELRGIASRVVPSRSFTLAPDVGAILSLASTPAAEGEQRVFLLTSPENPTGYVWSARSLQRLSRCCASQRHCLIVDHAFLLAGVQTKRPAALWDVVGKAAGLRFVALWDTGKTFGMAGDKLGFLLSTDTMRSFVSQAVAVLQLETPPSQVALCKTLLQAALAHDYVGWLRRVCIGNAETAERYLRPIGVGVKRPAAGSFITIDVSTIGPAVEVREALMAAGVGTVALATFFAHDSPVADRYLRIALAREPRTFRRAMSVTVSVLEVLRKSRTGSKDGAVGAR